MDRVRTLCCEQLFLRRGLVIDAVEGEGELLRLVPGIGNLDNVAGLPVVVARRTDNDVLVDLLFQEWTYPCNNPHRHRMVLLISEKE